MSEYGLRRRAGGLRERDEDLSRYFLRTGDRERELPNEPERCLRGGGDRDAVKARLIGEDLDRE